MQVFQEYAYYYNLFYGNKDYQKEATIVDQFLQQNACGECEKRILNIGCGTGKHDIEFNKLGYMVHGIDLSEDMISIAQKNRSESANMTYEVADARNFSVEKKFDFIVSLFHVMSYQNSNEDLHNVFDCVDKALSSNGIFVFDAWYGPGVLTDKPSVRVKRVEDEENLFVRLAEPIMHPNENIVDVCYDILVIDKRTNETKNIKEVHNMRYFFVPEIKELLSAHGMKLLAVYDCETLKAPDFNSWTTYFVVGRL